MQYIEKRMFWLVSNKISTTLSAFFFAYMMALKNIYVALFFLAWVFISYRVSVFNNVLMKRDVFGFFMATIIALFIQKWWAVIFIIISSVCIAQSTEYAFEDFGVSEKFMDKMITFSTLTVFLVLFGFFGYFNDFVGFISNLKSQGLGL